MNKNLTPEQKLMVAIYGTTEPTEEQINEIEERFYEHEANSVTDEEFKERTGMSVDEFGQHMMLFAGWCEAVAKWMLEHGSERKYNVFPDEHPMLYTSKQIIDMCQMFYRQGREDAQDGTSEYDRLYSKNKKG